MCGKNKWKKSKKERAMRGIAMGIKKELIDKNERIRSVEEGLMEGKVKKGGEK